MPLRGAPRGSRLGRRPPFNNFFQIFIRTALDNMPRRLTSRPARGFPAQGLASSRTATRASFPTLDSLNSVVVRESGRSINPQQLARNASLGAAGVPAFAGAKNGTNSQSCSARSDFDRLKSHIGVVAELVPATPNRKAQSKNNRGAGTSPATTRGRDQVLQRDRNPLSAQRHYWRASGHS